METYLRKLFKPVFVPGFAFALSLFILTACGGGSSGGNAASNAGAPAVAAPTMPAGNFVAVGEQSALASTASLTATSATTATTTATETAPAASAATVDLTRGENAYIKNKCGDCHGANGEGIADKGSAIAGTTLSLADFDAVLRTGRGLGNSHIFGRSAVSPSGMEILYAYVQSLGQ